MTAVSDILEVLAAAGFAHDGQTSTEQVIVPTMRSPRFGRCGGELRTFGGRKRFTKPGTAVRVTVGPRTMNVYTAVKGDVRFLANWDTKDVDLGALKALLDKEIGK